MRSKRYDWSIEYGAIIYSPERIRDNNVVYGGLKTQATIELGRNDSGWYRGFTCDAYFLHRSRPSHVLDSDWSALPDLNRQHIYCIKRGLCLKPDVHGAQRPTWTTSDGVGCIK